MKLTYNEIGKLDIYLRQINLKGTAVIDAAISLVKLKPHLEVIETTKKNLLAKFNKGSEQIDSKNENWLPFITELEACLLKEAEVDGLKVIKTEDIDTARTNSQEAIAELMKLDVIKV